MRYVAYDLGVTIGRNAINISVELEGDPMTATAAEIGVDYSMLNGSDPAVIIERAKAKFMVSNYLRQGVPVKIGSIKQYPKS